MRRTAIIVLMGSALAACSTTPPPTYPTFAHKHMAPKAWIDPPQVRDGPGVPNPAGLD